jgi:ribosome-associated translation inhibitor RaiA
MRFPETSYNLRIQLYQHECDLSSATLEQFERGLEPLRKPVEKFPISDLHISVTFQPRSQAYHVKTVLVLPGRSLAANELDQAVYSAFERCVRKLARRLEAYVASMAAMAEVAKYQKGTHHEVIPEREPDAQALQQAVEEQSYARFRAAMDVYEEVVRKRIGRWIERYPDLGQQLDTEGGLSLDDAVEEVFLNAFEQYDRRPEGVRFGQWLEQLIDPSIRLLTAKPDEELENINFARTLRDAEPS